jgi:hypothetical protein
MTLPCADIKARLDAANRAYDRLVAGEQVVVIVDAFRSRVEYKPAELSQLTQQIAVLQAQYDACINPGKVTALTRPVTFRF